MHAVFVSTNYCYNIILTQTNQQSNSIQLSTKLNFFSLCWLSWWIAVDVWWEWVAAPLATNSTNKTITNSFNAMNLFVLWFVGWLPPPSASAVFASFHQNNFHFISIVFLPFSNRPSNHFSSRNGLWPGARSPSAFTIQSICPFGRADWNELLNCWMGRAVAVSIAIPFIIPFKNSKFFHSMNMQQLYWRQITVIISFLINPFHSTNERNESIKNEKFNFSLLVDEWEWLLNGLLPPPLKN